jgi:putative FmdB family regulatory protein
MPLYEFRCQSCGIFDEWRAMADSGNPAHCPTCQIVAQRIFSAPALQLNGSLRLDKRANPEPQLLQKQPSESSAKDRTRVRSHGGRPWMIGH